MHEIRITYIVWFRIVPCYACLQDSTVMDQRYDAEHKAQPNDTATESKRLKMILQSFRLLCIRLTQPCCKGLAKPHFR